MATPSQKNQAAAGMGCWSVFVGVAAGLLVSWNFGFPILLCMLIGLGANLTYAILWGIYARLADLV
jgi:hypothetical protein